jgi:two-component system, cell cycle sensor histidine kinase and response regulator CckA
MNGKVIGETLLLVEDHVEVRQLAERILREAGYRVLVAATPNEALDLADRHQGPLDGLVSDVVMPGMSGPEMAHLLARRFPGLRVLFLSGYSLESAVEQGLEPARDRLLEKPFQPRELLSAVRATLDEKA